MTDVGFGIRVSQGMSEIFRSLQQAEQEILERDKTIRAAFQFWFVVREISDHGPSNELLKKLDGFEREFLESLEKLGWKQSNWVLEKLVSDKCQESL